MIRDEIAGLIRRAAEDAIAAGTLPSVPLPEVTIDRPRLPEHGDYATNLPMRMQRSVGGNPFDIAERILRHLPASAMIGSAEAARPGFINLRLNERWLAEQVDVILERGEAFADSTTGAGERVQIEFVSANPTGALHLGNGRGAVFGSTLAAVLEATGRTVEREYYVNDAGTQIGVFARTVYARYQQLFGRPVEVPSDGYPDPYLIEVARKIKETHGDALLRPEGEEPPDAIGPMAIDLVVQGIQEDLAALNVHYDVWFRERSLYDEGAQYQRVMERLREIGYIVEKEGAIWFTSSEIGEDKDNVLVRSTGAPTYFASDIAYHFNKFVERGFDRVIDIWGADHHGHISRLKAAVGALGVEPERLHILLYQLVMLREGSDPVRMSKRAGTIVPLTWLVNEAGADACRFFFLQRSADSVLDFDLQLARTQSDKNPVYYVQYAHARIAGILRLAAERGLSGDGGDVALLNHPAELDLIRGMLQLPELLDQIARTLEPHHLPYYAMDLATTFHAFYRDVRVVGDDAALTRARLKLAAAARIALARTLHLMGMTAPERMEREAEDAQDDEAVPATR
jgi:arginyl-tRNA synthetase